MALTPQQYADLINGKRKPMKKKSWRDSDDMRQINWNKNSDYIKDGSREPYTLGQQYKKVK